MFRRILTVTAATGMVSALTVMLVANQQTGQTSKPMQGHDMSMDSMKGDMKTMTKAQKIANAISSAPVSITAKATILDWPAKDGMAPEVLRAGTNGWNCLPDLPSTAGNDPMCLDEPWMNWLQAYTAKKAPQFTKVGIGYMMSPGGVWGSNTDPFAMTETKDNQWSLHGPHLMILVPDPKALAGVSTDHHNGGPYVMWAGTPYAHIMAPTAPAAPTMKMKK